MTLKHSLFGIASAVIGLVVLIIFLLSWVWWRIAESGTPPHYDASGADFIVGILWMLLLVILATGFFLGAVGFIGHRRKKYVIIGIVINSFLLLIVGGTLSGYFYPYFGLFSLAIIPLLYLMWSRPWIQNI